MYHGSTSDFSHFDLGIIIKLLIKVQGANPNYKKLEKEIEKEIEKAISFK